MTYRGYRILLSYNINTFCELNEDGSQGAKVTGIDYDTMFLDEPWYAVVGEDNFVEQTFETLEEAKDYIEEQE